MKFHEVNLAYTCIYELILCVEILIGPRTRVVAPGELVTFVCHAIGESVYWYVNGSDPYPLQKYEARGFTFHYNETSSNTHNNTLIVEARPSNNNTRIACAASGSIHNQHGFQEGTLIIAGNNYYCRELAYIHGINIIQSMRFLNKR